MDKYKEPQSNNHPTQQVNKNITLFPILITFLITTLIVGSGVFYWQQYIFKNQIADLKTQLEEIDQLKEENGRLETNLEEIGEKTCTGVWQNGICIKSTCVDSDVNEKPDDIYIKGTVTYTDENGVETVVSDECTGSKEQVNEMWCYESPSGSKNYVQGKMVYNCTNGCLDGACLK